MSSDNKKSGPERRKAKRRPILETFSMFVVVPKKGVHRLQAHDVSELGVGFDLDTEGESLTDFVINKGEVLDFRFYLNQSLYIPLDIEITRIEERGNVRLVGGEFKDLESKAYKAYLAFIQMIDAISDEVRTDT